MVCLRRVSEFCSQQVNQGRYLLMFPGYRELLDYPFNLRSHNIRIQPFAQQTTNQPSQEKQKGIGHNTSRAAFFRFSYSLSARFRRTDAGIKDKASVMSPGRTRIGISRVPIKDRGGWPSPDLLLHESEHRGGQNRVGPDRNPTRANRENPYPNYSKASVRRRREDPAERERKRASSRNLSFLRELSLFPRPLLSSFSFVSFPVFYASLSPLRLLAFLLNHPCHMAPLHRRLRRGSRRFSHDLADEPTTLQASRGAHTSSQTNCPT